MKLSVLAVSAVLVLVITSLSAYLRLLQYGLGCPDWPACYGANPFGDAVLSETSPMFWIRVVHRGAATLAGLLFVAIAVLWWDGWKRGRERLVSLAPLALAAFLAWLGRYTPSALPAVTIGNLLGGMATLASLWWLWAVATGPGTRPAGEDARRTAGAAAVGLALLFAQIALGGLTSARFAAAACPAILECGNWSATFHVSGLNPFVDIARESVGEGTRQVLNVLHRAAGVAVAMYLVRVAMLALRQGGRARRFGALVLGLVIVQIAAATVMVSLDLPLALAVGHNVIAGLLIMVLVSLLAEGGAPESGSAKS